MFMFVKMMVNLLLDDIVVLADDKDNNTVMVFRPYDTDQNDIKKLNINKNTRIVKNQNAASHDGGMPF